MTTERNHHGFWNHVVRWLVAAALACLSLSGQAREHKYSDWEWAQDLNRSKPSFSGTPGGPSTSKATATGATVGGGSKPLPWPGKSQAENMAKWKSQASARDMAKAMTNPRNLTSPVTLVGGMLMKQLLDEVCVGVLGWELKPGAVWDECVQREVQQYQFCTYECGTLPAGTGGTGWHNTLQGAWSDYATRNPSSNRVNIRFAPYPGATVTYDIQKAPWEGTGYWQRDATIQASRRLITEVQNDPSERIPISGGIQEAEDRLTDKIAAWCQADFLYGYQENQGNCAGLMNEMMQKGLTVTVTDQPSEGPTTVPGNPVVKEDTAPDGRKRRTTTTTDSILTYNPDGTVTRTTKTTTKTEYQNPTTGEWEQEGSDIVEETKDDRTACEKDPSGAECQKQDEKEDRDVPTEELPKSTREVTYTPVDLGWGGGSCPGPYSWTDKLGAHNLNLQPYCNAITTWVKPLLLAFAALMALSICMAGLKLE